MSYRTKSVTAYRIEQYARNSDAPQVSETSRLRTPAFAYTRNIPVTFSHGRHDSSVHVPLPDVNSRFGLKLRTLRRERHWTQLEMAIILGINRSYISEIERGHKSASLGMLEIIALGFQISLADLLHGI